MQETPGSSFSSSLLTRLLGVPGDLALPPESRVTVDVERSISQRLWSEGWVPALLRGRISVRGAPCAGEAQTLEVVASAGLELGGRSLGGAWEGAGPKSAG